MFKHFIAVVALGVLTAAPLVVGADAANEEPPVEPHLRTDACPHEEQKATAAPATTRPAGVSGVVVHPTSVTPDQVARWTRDGVTAVAVVLDEQYPPAAYAAAAEAAAGAAVDLYYWVEVARNPAMARAHPEWMASLGIHGDWRKRFPEARGPGKGEVAKAFPWIPITYREAYDAHLGRVEGLLGRWAAGPYAGVLLNDLQGGPASCGCGNLLCRWATDYRVPSTATRAGGDDAATRFTADVRRLTPGKRVVPVWATECEDVDLPARRAPGGKSTGLCGGVECATGTCPKAFTKQWSALLNGHDGAVGVLALHGEFAREPDWVGRAARYLDEVPPKYGGRAVPRDRLWLVVQGHGLPPEERAQARRVAAAVGGGAVFEALVPLDQSYEPRVVTVNKP